MSKHNLPEFRVSTRLERIARFLDSERRFMRTLDAGAPKPARRSQHNIDHVKLLLASWPEAPTIEQLPRYDADCARGPTWATRTATCSACFAEAGTLLIVREQSGDYDGVDEVGVCFDCLGRMVGVAHRHRSA